MNGVGPRYAVTDPHSQFGALREFCQPLSKRADKPCWGAREAGVGLDSEESRDLAPPGFVNASSLPCCE